MSSPQGGSWGSGWGSPPHTRHGADGPSFQPVSRHRMASSGPSHQRAVGPSSGAAAARRSVQDSPSGMSTSGPPHAIQSTWGRSAPEFSHSSHPSPSSSPALLHSGPPGMSQWVQGTTAAVGTAAPLSPSGRYAPAGALHAGAGAGAAPPSSPWIS